MTGRPNMDVVAGQVQSVIERKTGIALWRQIADLIRAESAHGLVDMDGKLPAETALAKRFGVNRHTIRAAISALSQEGAVRAEQGRGTYFIHPKRLAYPISKRTRFSAGLQGQTKNRSGELFSANVEPANEEVASALALELGRNVIRTETLSRADGTAISRTTSWFNAGTYAEIGAIYKKSGSFTASLAAIGIKDYIRASTTIDARHASSSDTKDLQLSPGAIVLVTHAVDCELDGTPISYAITRFAADRVEFRIEGD